jgi:lactoylglutathione lyase
MKKILPVLFVLMFSKMAYCQNKNDFSLKFNHVAVSVKDVDVSAAFYKNTLNLEEITNRTKKEGIRWFSLSDGKELHLIATIKEPVTLNKAVHFAMSTSHFNAFLMTIQNNKITYSDWLGQLNTVTTRADGIKQIYIQDPDGYWIEINGEE